MKKNIAAIYYVLVCTVCSSFHSKNFSATNSYIIIDKSDYELSVFDAKGWQVTYPVVFGNGDLKDKMCEGDRETPEGSFTIINKKVHDKWHRFMLLNYPNKESYQKFTQRKASGMIPQNARIGGGIGIHGTWPHEGYVIDQYQNWTEGCISMRNEDVEELFDMIETGTPVYIRK